MLKSPSHHNEDGHIRTCRCQVTKMFLKCFSFLPINFNICLASIFTNKVVLKLQLQGSLWAPFLVASGIQPQFNLLKIPAGHGLALTSCHILIIGSTYQFFSSSIPGLQLLINMRPYISLPFNSKIIELWGRYIYKIKCYRSKKEHYSIAPWLSNHN